jgi:DNA helicase-2/ATP-dependent DNA helicase PcrA
LPVDLADLNDSQRQAVECTDGPLLVLAGAGSGKTRVLTYRIAHLIEDLGVSPYQILAITFTNKAAAEMRERLGRLLGAGTRGMWVATFHAACVRMLRADAELLGYSRDFSIYDEDDSRRLVKAIFNDLEIDTRQFAIAGVRERISRAKNELLTADDYSDQAANGYDRLVARVFAELQLRLQRANAMDFDDLLVNTWLLLSRNPQVLSAYQQRFRYLLVDEYQDTNHAQYRITELLAQASRNIMVVGDDDQSIYSWRGADLRNILEFERDYPEAVVIKLEQNYRSTATILSAANAVIANNENRKAKKLFTEGDTGDKIALYQAADERDEGRWIAAEVERMHRQGRSYCDFAVFYRTNAQSRVLEDMLLRAGVPYRIVGGTRFFDRAEIRDVMAYLKLVVNPADDIAAKRVINVPRRGIGKTTEARIDEIARTEGCPFLEACELALLDESIGSKTRNTLAQFLQLIREAGNFRGELRHIVELIVEKSGLITALEAERTDEAQSRIENIREFFSVAQEFDQTHDEEALQSEVSGFAEVLSSDTSLTGPAAPGRQSSGQLSVEDGRSPRASLPADSSTIADVAEDVDVQFDPSQPLSKLPAFMEWLALRSDLDSLIAGEDYLTLMTVHSAKGLEFPVVFIAGLEESIFPHSASSDDPSGLEEERRLAYVAITRARQLLFATHAQVRNLYGSVQVNPRSRFVAEIPEELLRLAGVGSQGYLGTGWEKRGDRSGTFGSGSRKERGEGRIFGSGGSGQGSKGGTGNMGNQSAGTTLPTQAQRQAREAVVYAVGDTIDHKTFGRGQITAIEGDALHIHFSASGQTKKLLKGYAPIVKIS